MSLQAVVNLFNATLFNPLLSGLAAGALALQSLQPDGKIDKDALLAILKTEKGIKVCLGLFLVGLVIRLNGAVSRRALNPSGNVRWTPKGEVALVTGGAGGIGAEIVKLMSARGVPVVVVDVLPLQFTPSNDGAPVSYYKCDITDYDAFQKVANRIREEVGSPTVVFANAGFSRTKPILELSTRELGLMNGVNINGVLWTIKLFVPDMVKKNHGHIVITASSAAYVSNPRMAPYCGTKSAVLAIWEGLHAELIQLYKAPRVKASVVCPMLVTTKMFDGMASPGFMAPPLKPIDVALPQVQAVVDGEARHIMIPRAFGLFLGFVRAWPSWVSVLFARAAGETTVKITGHDPLA